MMGIRDSYSTDPWAQSVLAVAGATFSFPMTSTCQHGHDEGVSTPERIPSSHACRARPDRGQAPSQAFLLSIRDQLSDRQEQNMLRVPFCASLPPWREWTAPRCDHPWSLLRTFLVLWPKCWCFVALLGAWQLRVVPKLLRLAVMHSVEYGLCHFRRVWLPWLSLGVTRVRSI